MQRRAFSQGCLWACLALAGSGFAQEGHPLSGTWSGDWGPAGGQRTHLTVVMNWDGQKVSGLLNPGPRSAPLANVILDVANWTVRLEADAKDASGKAIHISAEGRLEDLGSRHRTLSGAWHEGSAEGDFKLTRE